MSHNRQRGCLQLRALSRIAAVLSLIVLSLACGGTSSSTISTPTQATPPATSSSLAVLVNPTLLGVGEMGRALASLRPSGSDITGQTSWQSLNPTIATISSTGTVTALNSGTTLIQGMYNGVSATFPLEVISGTDIVQLIISGGTVTMGQLVGY